MLKIKILLPIFCENDRICIPSEEILRLNNLYSIGLLSTLSYLSFSYIKIPKTVYVLDDHLFVTRKCLKKHFSLSDKNLDIAFCELLDKKMINITMLNKEI